MNTISVKSADDNLLRLVCELAKAVGCEVSEVETPTCMTCGSFEALIQPKPMCHACFESIKGGSK